MVCDQGAKNFGFFILETYRNWLSTMNNNTASKWALTQYYCSWLNPKIYVPLTQMHEDLWSMKNNTCPWNWQKLDNSTMNNNSGKIWGFSSLKLTKIGHFKYEEQYCAEGAKIFLSFSPLNWQKLVISTTNNNIAPKARRFYSFSSLKQTNWTFQLCSSSLKLTEIGQFKHEQ